MKASNRVLSGYQTTIFEVMSRLARDHDAINLGQGFPDDKGPAELRTEAARALEHESNQYPPMMGVPALRQAVAAHDHRFYGLDVDWQSQVMVTSGATEALAACLFGLLDDGDEAIVFEPVYDSYVPIIRRAGATAVPVRLEPPDWIVPDDALAAAFSEHTKLVILNSPMNPSGKVFSPNELARLADLMKTWDVIGVCDEVYEHIVFGRHGHVPLMTLPGMAERCLRIGSAGKSFSLTGWKVGYLTGPAELLGPVAKAHQFLTYTTPPNLQRAVALGLALPDAYFESLSRDMRGKRDRLRGGLERAGLRTATCDGTYFLNADFSPLGFAGDDVAFCKELTVSAGVCAIPNSAFYLEPGPSTVVRFCFCKSDDALDEACRRIAAWVERRR